MARSTEEAILEAGGFVRSDPPAGDVEPAARRPQQPHTLAEQIYSHLIPNQTKADERKPRR